MNGPNKRKRIREKFREKKQFTMTIEKARNTRDIDVPVFNSVCQPERLSDMVKYSNIIITREVIEVNVGRG